MGYSCGDNTTSQKVDDSGEETRGRIPMDTHDHHHHHHHHDGVENDVELWPVEHPMEPPDEDRPVKCPMPHSSVINESGMSDRRSSEILRKRVEIPAAASTGKEKMAVVAAGEPPPVRAVRKRHHTLTHTTMMRMPPPLPTHNITIFQVLDQLDTFES